MKKIILAIAFLMFSAMLYEVKAGPPENAQKLMIPFPVICTPTMTDMMTALTKDYAVHISMTFEETPITGIVILENPNTRTAAILHIRTDRTCLVFSGLNLMRFDRPEGMALPAEEVQQDFKES